MSQQPPYGPPDPSQPQQPYQPYGAGAYPNPYAPNPYAQLPQQKSHTTRNVLLIVGAVMLLFCGGLVALGVLAFNSVDEAIDDAFDTDYRGSESDPLVIEEGDSFEIRGYSYSSGWSFVPAGPSGIGSEVEGLVVTDNRDDTDYSGPSIVFTFYDGNQALGQVDCYTTVDLRRGTSTELDCIGADDVPTDYERLEVYDDALYE